MRHSFGPWATAVHSGSSQHLSTFWRQRLARLPLVVHDKSGLARRTQAVLALLGALLVVLPTLRDRGTLAKAEESPAASAPAQGNASAQVSAKPTERAKERVLGPRPQGTCSIHGKVVSAESGKPLEHARMYLHYKVTQGSIFVYTAADGTFELKDIPTGPFSLQMSHTPGYQYLAYNPDGVPGEYPPFTLQEGEQRTGVELRAHEACRISGKIREEDGSIPKNIETLSVLAWRRKAADGDFTSVQGDIWRADGSYIIDWLDERPAYIMVIDWKEAKQGTVHPPVYYPGTFSRSEAEQVVFEKVRRRDNIDITLRKGGGAAIEGTVRDEQGNPVPEAFIVAHRRDMCFDYVTAYSDAQGQYRIAGLAEGEFLVHADAMHRGLVRWRSPVDIARNVC